MNDKIFFIEKKNFIKKKDKKIKKYAKILINGKDAELKSTTGYEIIIKNTRPIIGYWNSSDEIFIKDFFKLLILRMK